MGRVVHVVMESKEDCVSVMERGEGCTCSDGEWGGLCVHARMENSVPVQMLCKLRR